MTTTRNDILRLMLGACMLWSSGLTAQVRTTDDEGPLIPFQVGARWVYHIGLNGWSSDAPLYDTVTVISGCHSREGDIWTVQSYNGISQYVTRNDSVFSFMNGATDLLYARVSTLPWILAGEPSPSVGYFKRADWCEDRIVVPAGNFMGSVMITTGMVIMGADDLAGYSTTDYLVPRVGLVLSVHNTVASCNISGPTTTRELVSFTRAVTSIPASHPQPSDFELSQNFPNPFNPVTTIGYTVPARTFVTLTVYDMMGRTAAVLEQGEKEAGRYEVHWNAAGMASGVYLCRLQAGPSVRTRRMDLVK